MVDIVKLSESLEFYNKPPVEPLTRVLWDAAHAYQDLLGNRVEPDYEAGAAVFARHHGLPPERLSHGARRIVDGIVDAAISGKLLVVYPKEAENG